VSLVRLHAGEWNLNPQRIGILGFSAGGHLAAMAATNYDKRQYDPIDDTDKVSCRPDFAVLVYPAYLLADKPAAGNKAAAGGKRLSPDLRVNGQTPPIFFAHAGNDRVDPEGSVTMYLALRAAKVAGELHIYTTGGHGFGLRATDNPCCTWPQRCGEWMKSQGLLSKSSK
jgi:acetyl esterase/lipase